MRLLVAVLVLGACLVVGSGCVFTLDKARNLQILQNWADDFHYIQQDFDYIYCLGQRSPLHRYQD